MTDSSPVQPVPVLLLGSSHFGEWDGTGGQPDILTPERQAEVADLVERLAVFAPTKVAVEVQATDQAKLDRWYREYVDGQHAQRRSEDFQIGFRLARVTGATVHAIDADWTLDGEGIEDYLERHPDETFVFGELTPEDQRLFDEVDRLPDSSPLADYLLELNRPPHVFINDAYFLDRCLPIGYHDNEAGLALVLSWYRRNLRIFANLQLIAEPGDRIFVVYGGGHVPSLRSYIETSGRFELVTPDAFFHE